MKEVRGFPPNYKEIEEVLHPRRSAVFTYGDTIYIPYYEGSLSYDLIVHEETHKRQQGAKPDLWWTMYLKDPKFRLNQEVEAYRNQYRFFAKGRDRNMAYKFLYIIAHDLSSAMYGNIITHEEAIK